MESPREHEKRDVEQYLLSQVDDATVKTTQRVSMTKVLGRPHEIWDVQTYKDRYWVITNPTNYYVQRDFPEYGTALTFHVGLSTMLAERSRKQLDEDDLPTSTAWRKHGQAVDAYNTANEAEDYQAVGIRCREALLATVPDLADLLELPESERPQRSNFKAWADIAVERIATGRLRAYAKTLTDKTWDLAVWLQHYSDATPWDAELVLDATGHLLGVLDMAEHRHREGQPRRCPQCSSYRVSDVGEVMDDGDAWESRWTCAACEFAWDHRVQRWDEESRSWSPSDAESGEGGEAPAG
ncbi:MAG: hypothetical protein JWP11_934 [Frankiales bacterium]|nr:hypothetical protein [Frankiales bacterium]